MTLAVSVVIACRNEASRLRSCLEALAAQDIPRDRFEVLVVDGGSTDGSREIALRLGARVLQDGGGGPSGARNVGLHAARADVIAFTDADCVPRTDWLSGVMEVFAEDPTLSGVAGAIRMPRDSFLGRLEDDEARTYYRGLITSNVAYRRDALLAVGGFDETLRCAEDYDLAWRTMDAGYRVAHDPRPVVVHSPPEIHASLGVYLRKQFWYARHDVPAHLRAVGRHRRTALAAGSATATLGAVEALRDGAWTACLAAGMATRSRAIVATALGAAAIASYTRVERAAQSTGERDETTRRVAVLMLRRFARGAGTIAGYVDLALAPLAPFAPLRLRTSSAPEPSPVAAVPRAARARPALR